MLDQKDVTIIIPHFGANEQQCYALKHCLSSLKETVKSPVLVVKNGPPCPCYRDIRILEQGQCKAVNAAAAIVNTPWILVTNDDMIYAPEWFERLSESTYFSQCQCVSPQLVEPREGAPTFILEFCGGAGGDFDREKWLRFAKSRMDLPYTPSAIKTGFNLPFLIRKELWDLVGGYDINYDPWGSNSDSDLEYKIKLAGVQTYQNRNSVVYHFSQTSGTFEPQNGGAWGKNWQYFIDKWGFPRTDDGIWEATFKIPSVAEGRKFQPDWENKYGNK